MFIALRALRDTGFCEFGGLQLCVVDLRGLGPRSRVIRLVSGGGRGGA